MNRTQTINAAITELTNELMAKGLSPSSAGRFARVALSRSNVEIGKNGRIFVGNTPYSAKDFASSKLVSYITGAQAKQANQDAILADPGYQLSVAQLGLTRDQGLGVLGDQQRQAELDFGDPNFVQSDPTLAAAVAANPFSTSNLLKQAYERQQSTVNQEANRAGTRFGGGYVSGQQEAQRIYAGNQQQATTSFANLLSSINAQKANLGQTYDLGQRTALLQAQQSLLNAGVLKPVTPPNMTVGKFHWHPAPHPPGAPTGPGTGSAGPGTGGHHPPPPPPPPGTSPGLGLLGGRKFRRPIHHLYGGF